MTSIIEKSDNLGLNTVLGVIPGGHTQLVEEANDVLRDQIRSLEDENGRLQKLLAERNYELKKCQKRLEEERLVCSISGDSNGIAPSDAVSMKIVNISRKNRELTAALEKERTQRTQMSQAIKELEQKLNSADGTSTKGFKSLTQTDDPSEVCKLEEKLKECEKKLKDTVNKMSEYRNQVEKLKKDLKVAHKIITNEVGEGITIEALAKGNSGTSLKGRAQQVLMLQQKVAELKALTASTAESGSEHCGIASATTMVKSPAKTSEERQRQKIKQMEAEKKETVNSLSVELRSLQSELSQIQSRYESCKARNLNLSRDLKSAQIQINVLNQKSRHDDELIAALTKQTEQLEKILREKTHQLMEGKFSVEKSEFEKLQNKNLQDSHLIDQLRDALEEKEKCMSLLQEQIKHCEEQRGGGEGGVDAVYSVTDTNNKENICLMTGDNKRSINFQTETQEHMKLQVLYQTLEVERDKLAEVINLQNHRIEDHIKQITTMNSEIQTLNQQTVRLEKQVEQLQTERQQRLSRSKQSYRVTNQTPTRQTTHATNPHIMTSSSTSLTVEEAAMKIDSLLQENRTIRSALNATLKAKHEDLELYEQILRESKALYKQQQ